MKIFKKRSRNSEKGSPVQPSQHPNKASRPSMTTSFMVGTFPPLQVLNHFLPIKLDWNNYILWWTQMENVRSVCKRLLGLYWRVKALSSKGNKFWRFKSRIHTVEKIYMFTWFICSTLTFEIMGQIMSLDLPISSFKHFLNLSKFKVIQFTYFSFPKDKFSKYMLNA